MVLTPEKKIVGLLAPLFALRSENDLGIGDIGALRDFIDWASENGFGLIQLLPVNETGNDHSPYNAVSSVAIDPTSIEITPTAIPDLTEEDISVVASKVDLAALRSGPVNYHVVKPLKLKLLDKAFARFGKVRGSRAQEFRTFCEEEASWLEDYALFRVLMDRHGTECWDAWPQEVRSAEVARIWLSAQRPTIQRSVERAQRLVKYRQWIAWTQWRAIKRHAEAQGVALMGDIPFGVSYYSADTWSRPRLFDLEWFGGCPPETILEVDAFTRKWGQNWGIPLYRWDAHREENYAWWRQRVRKIRDVFHLFRIDHILGVFRIYSFPWRPTANGDFLPLNREEAAARTGGKLPHFTPHDDVTPKHQALNARQGEEVLRALVEECGAFRLVGEDLGVVPPYVRPCLQRLDIAGFKVPQWETERDGHLIDGSKYERLSLATYATHDHDPVRAMWESWMAAINEAENGDAKTHSARDKAWRECRAIAGWSGFDVPRLMPWSDKIQEQLLRSLLQCNSWLVVLMITDLFATTQRFNVPGAVSDANWSERLDGTPAKWRENPELMARVARICALAADAGRLIAPIRLSLRD
jgi:4-alpha-glucanotransferase